MRKWFVYLLRGMIYARYISYTHANPEIIIRVRDSPRSFARSSGKFYWITNAQRADVTVTLQLHLQVHLWNNVIILAIISGERWIFGNDRDRQIEGQRERGKKEKERETTILSRSIAPSSVVTFTHWLFPSRRCVKDPARQERGTHQDLALWSLSRSLKLIRINIGIIFQENDGLGRLKIR